MTRLTWTKQAIEDIDKIAEYIALESEYYAKIKVKRIFQKALFIESQPLIGRIERN